MEYVVPLLIVLVIVIVVVVGARLLGRHRQDQEPQRQPSREGRSSDDGGAKKRPDGAGQRSRRGREITPEDAAAASARLAPEAHRKIYSLIAQRQVMNAVKEYRKATGLGLGEAAAAVAALAQFPQPSPQAPRATETSPGKDKPSGPTAEPAPSPTSGTPVIADGPLTVEDIMRAAEKPWPEDSANPAPDAAPSFAEKPGPSSSKPVATPSLYRYRAIVSQGNEIREVASTRLNEEIFQNILRLARSGALEAAIQELRDHSDVGLREAQEFVALIGPEE